MERMTAKWLSIFIADEFHDWIDGEDAVETYRRFRDNKVWVKFESGAQFVITIAEVYE